MQSPLALFLKRFSFRNMPKSEKVPTKRSIFDLVHMVQMLRAIYRSVCFLSLLNHEECRANIKSEPGNHHGHLAPIINPQRFSSWGGSVRTPCWYYESWSIGPGYAITSCASLLGLCRTVTGGSGFP